jgi:hypothetical protein
MKLFLSLIQKFQLLFLLSFSLISVFEVRGMSRVRNPEFASRAKVGKPLKRMTRTNSFFELPVQVSSYGLDCHNLVIKVPYDKETELCNTDDIKKSVQKALGDLPYELSGIMSIVTHLTKENLPLTNRIKGAGGVQYNRLKVDAYSMTESSKNHYENLCAQYNQLRRRPVA